MRRRYFITSGTAGGVVLLAGCTGGPSRESPSAGTDPTTPSPSIGSPTGPDAEPGRPTEAPEAAGSEVDSSGPTIFDWSGSGC